MELPVEKHGGQDIYENLDKLIEDFSVTTNYRGPNEKAMEHIKNKLHLIHHYPKEDKQPYKDNLLSFLFKNVANSHTHLLLGNGASELIDLIIRVSCILHPEYTSYFVHSVQYKEYERSCKIQKLHFQPVMEEADVISIINPCNPTGTYLDIHTLINELDKCKKNSTILIDESMQLWKGADFRTDSMISHYKYIQHQLLHKNIKIFIIHSYTKFFSCTGLRIGSVLCPDNHTENTLLYYQNPWSNNILSLEYLNVCVQDEQYCNKTWDTTEKMREYQIEQIYQTFPEWKIHGSSFLSWIWMELPDERMAEKIYNISKQQFMPIRWGKMGYHKPTFLRVAVRENHFFDTLLNVWKQELLSCPPFYDETIKHNEDTLSLITIQYYSNFYWNQKVKMDIQIKKVKINELKIHEEYNIDNLHFLYNYYMNLPEHLKIIPTILVDIHTNVIIDGHHRFQLFKKLNHTYVYVSYIDYLNSDNIVVNAENPSLTKHDVIKMGLSNDLYPQKTTRHNIIIHNMLQPIICLSTNLLSTIH